MVKTDATSKQDEIKKQENELITEIRQKTNQHITEKSSICSIAILLAAVVNKDHQSNIQGILNQLGIEYYQGQIIAELAKSPYLTAEEKLQIFAEQEQNLKQEIPQACALTAFISIEPDFRDKVIKLRDDPSQYSYPEMQIALILATRTHPQESDTDAIAQLRSDQSQALRLIRRLNSDYDKAEALVQLAPHLLPNLSIEAESIAQDIEKPYHRTRSLIALSDYFPSIRSEIFSQSDKLENDGEYVEYTKLNIISLCEMVK